MLQHTHTHKRDTYAQAVKRLSIKQGVQKAVIFVIFSTAAAISYFSFSVNFSILRAVFDIGLTWAVWS